MGGFGIALASVFVGAGLGIAALIAWLAWAIRGTAAGDAEIIRVVFDEPPTRDDDLDLSYGDDACG